MTKFKPVTLVHQDGRERVAYSQGTLVQAEFDGFAPKAAEDVTAADKLAKATDKAAAAGKPAPSAAPTA